MSNNKLHIFGGFSGSSHLQTSEIISMDGGVEYGPELPVAVSDHAITSINSTLSLLSGGTTDATTYSPLTWFFDHENNVFSSGPSLLQGRRRHGSATCVDKVTKEKIPMVAGGHSNVNGIYLPHMRFHYFLDEKHIFGKDITNIKLCHVLSFQ